MKISKSILNKYLPNIDFVYSIEGADYIQKYREKNYKKYYKLYRFCKRNKNKDYKIVIPKLNKKFGIRIKKIRLLFKISIEKLLE